MGWLRPKLRKNSKLCPGLVDHYRKLRFKRGALTFKPRKTERARAASVIGCGHPDTNRWQKNLSYTFVFGLATLLSAKTKLKLSFHRWGGCVRITPGDLAGEIRFCTKSLETQVRQGENSRGTVGVAHDYTGEHEHSEAVFNAA